MLIIIYLTYLYICLYSVFGSGGLTSLSPSSRESVDPIAELLSQLSGVRRSASNTNSNTPSQLQQLQMQLQLERQQVSVARQHLERLPRRQNQSQNTLRETGSTASPSYSLIMNTSTSTAQASNTTSNIPNTPSNFLLEGLLEELYLQPDSETVTEDAEQFVEELLIGSMIDHNNTLVAVNSTNLNRGPPVRVPPPGLGDIPAPYGRVLRGRARGDETNAARRADANKIQMEGKPSFLR